MLLRRIYNDALAQASYLIGCNATGDALIVDPNRDIDQYVALAEREGLRISAVTETHIHADYVSGARELAARTGATLYLSDEGTPEWKYAYATADGATLLRDGDTFMVGNIRIQAWHTPGHTPEHLSFLVTDTAGADQPIGICTGDFVFAGDVGRPDLLERAAGVTGTMEAGARQLFQSLQRFRSLPDWLQVWPGHGAGSACGKALGAVPQTTVGYEKLFNWAFSTTDEDQFVAEVLAGQPEPPAYFAQMKRVNKAGPARASDLQAPARLPAARLAGELAAGLVVVDTRPTDSYAGRYIPGTVNIPLGSSFLTWAGWLLPYDRPFALIVEDEAIDATLAELRLIGLDHVAGYWSPDAIESWAAAGGQLAAIERVEPAELQSLRDAVVLDVRGASEYEDGHIPGSRNIPLGYLAARLADVPLDRPVVVQCQSGMRSAIAAGLLAKQGRTNVRDLRGGFDAWRAAGQPVEVEAREAVPAHA